MKRFAWVALLASALCLTGCAGSQQYAGISLRAGSADPALQDLARHAMAGDKEAQLRLAVYYQYASYGRGVDVQSLFDDHAQDADIKFVSSLLEIELAPKEIAEVGSPWLVYMTRARALLESAAADSGGEKILIVPSSSQGGAVSTSRFSTGSFRKGLPDAAARLAVVNQSIWRQSFVTNFDDPLSDDCQSGYYSYSDWQRDAHFIVEGHLTARLVDPGDDPKSATAMEPRVRNVFEGPYYEADIEIVKFLKWPDEFPRPTKLSFREHVVNAVWFDEESGGGGPGMNGGYFGCRSWAPDRAPADPRAIVILQYSNDPFGSGKFHIVKTFSPHSID